MSARQQLEALGVPADVLDAYERDIRAEAAALLYDADSGTCGCGCWCAELIDPDRPCPQCDGDGGRRMGQACYVCGLERTKPEDPPGPSILPLQIYQGMLAHVLGVQPLRPRPTYSGVLAYLEDGER